MNVKLTLKQQNLYENQKLEPLITYINSKGDRVFGLLRCRKADIYTTLSLRPLYDKGMLELKDSITLDLKSGDMYGFVCQIKEV